MKKKLVLGTILASVMLGGSVFASTTGLYQGLPIVNMTLDGQTIKGDVPAVNLNGRTMVPVRFVTEALGGGVEWDAKTQTAILKKPSLKLTESDVSKLHIQALKFSSRITENYRKLIEIHSATYTISNGFTLMAATVGTKNQPKEIDQVLNMIHTMIDDEKKEITKLKADSASLISDAKKKYGVDISDMNTILAAYEQALANYSSAYEELSDYTKSKDQSTFNNYLAHVKSGDNKSAEALELSENRYQFHYKALQSY